MEYPPCRLERGSWKCSLLIRRGFRTGSELSVRGRSVDSERGTYTGAGSCCDATGFMPDVLTYLVKQSLNCMGCYRRRRGKAERTSAEQSGIVGPRYWVPSHQGPGSRASCWFETVAAEVRAAKRPIETKKNFIAKWVTHKRVQVSFRYGVQKDEKINFRTFLVFPHYFGRSRTTIRHSALFSMKKCNFRTTHYFRPNPHNNQVQRTTFDNTALEVWDLSHHVDSVCLNRRFIIKHSKSSFWSNKLLKRTFLRTFTTQMITWMTLCYPCARFLHGFRG